MTRAPRNLRVPTGGGRRSGDELLLDVDDPTSDDRQPGALATAGDHGREVLEHRAHEFGAAAIAVEQAHPDVVAEGQLPQARVAVADVVVVLDRLAGLDVAVL